MGCYAHPSASGPQGAPLISEHRLADPPPHVVARSNADVRHTLEQSTRHIPTMSDPGFGCWVPTRQSKNLCCVRDHAQAVHRRPTRRQGPQPSS